MAQPTKILSISLIYALLAGFFLMHHTSAPDNSATLSESYTTNLREISPTHILMGNSMLVSRIDSELIQQLVGPNIRTALIAENGTASAFWYLAYKNYVMTLDEPPEKTFIFFVGNDLTCPLEKLAVENHIEQIELAKRGREGEFDTIINDFKYEGVKGRLVSIGDMLDIPEKQSSVQKVLTDSVIDLTGTDQRVLDYANQYFFWANFAVERGEDVVVESTEECGWDFEKDNPRSFLPLMIEMSKELPDELIFIRIERKPDSDGSTPTVANEETYMDELFEYFDENDIKYYDLREMSGITESFFRDAFHVNDPYAYTKIFYQYMKGEFE